MNYKLAAAVLELSGHYFAACAEAVRDNAPEDQRECEHPEEKRTPVTMGGKNWKCECGHEHWEGT